MDININEISSLHKNTDSEDVLEKATSEYVDSLDGVSNNKEYLLRSLRLKNAHDNIVFLNYELLYHLIKKYIPKDLKQYTSDFYSLVIPLEHIIDEEDIISHKYLCIETGEIIDITIMDIIGDEPIPDDINDRSKYIEISRRVFLDDDLVRIDYSNRYLNKGWFSVGYVDDSDKLITHPKVDNFFNNWFNVLKNKSILDIVEELKFLRKIEIVSKKLSDKDTDKTYKVLNTLYEHKFSNVTTQRLAMHEKIFPIEHKKFLTLLSCKHMESKEHRKFKKKYGSKINKKLNYDVRSRYSLNKINNFIQNYLTK